jgi:hypothetical protein
MKNIHVLHTDKPSILFYLNSTLRLEFITVERKTNQHIYITNDDKVKEGDWYLDTIINTLFMMLKQIPNRSIRILVPVDYFITLDEQRDSILLTILDEKA